MATDTTRESGAVAQPRASAAFDSQQVPEFLPRIGRHLAHELNNPISAISSAAFLIQDFIDTAEGGQLDTEMVKPFIESIREECNKMKGIVEEFAKYVTTENILAMSLDLNEFLRNRAGEIGREGLPINFKESAEPVTIFADAGQLQFVLKSLAVYAQQSGATEVSFEVEKGKDCVIRVKDNRPVNMTEEEIGDVFNPLPTKRTPGLGLKLPLVKKVIDLHHGSIEMTSENGKGVTICLVLPLSQ
jgi:signal transduction histidine kinase